MKFVASGLAFPDADVFMASEVSAAGTYQLPNLEAALRYVTDFGCAIDCGAHVGTWSKVMAQRFTRVVAVEPSDDTFECLQLNLLNAGLDNVNCVRAAVGCRAGLVTMAIDAQNKARGNTGARHVRAGGKIPVITIDSLALEHVGFIKLDIEGSEPDALRGAKDTIARCRPVILYEDKKLWHRYFGQPKESVANFLHGQGYQQTQLVACDAIWTRRAA